MSNQEDAHIPETRVLKEQSPLGIGDVVADKYKIAKLLGRGGMGTVYQVDHLLLKKPFALKVLHGNISEEDRQRFAREATLAMEFSHEHALQIRDFGETKDGHQYFTMDFSPGVALKTIISQKPLEEKRALKITTQMLSALQSAHNKGIAHRDLKPANILIENRQGQDHALVLDFGIAKVVREDSQETQLTQKGTLGTPHYMSPEQVSGEKMDTRTDLYSLGIILYEMLTGQLPFSGVATVDIMVARVLKTPPPIRSVNPNVSIQTENIINKALQKDPEQRFKDAKEFIAELDKGIEQPTTAAETEVFVEEDIAFALTKEKSSKKYLGVAFVIVAIVVIAIATTITSKNTPPKIASKKTSKKISQSKNMSKSSSKKTSTSKSSKKTSDKNPWKKFFNGKWFDFTHPDWQKLTVANHIRYAKEYQDWYAKEKKVQTIKTLKKAGVAWKFALIPPGKFWMGANSQEPEEKPRHKVTIAKAFWMSECEITQKQWLAITRKKPWLYRAGAKNNLEHPANFVSRHGIKEKFLPALGWQFSLPSEAQWEYTARAGTLTRFYWGEDTKLEQISNYAWNDKNKSGHHPRKVKQKKSNAWGLYDMSGNLWEWCEDGWHSSYKNANLDGSPPRKKFGEERYCIRGGGYNSSGQYCRVNVRGRQNQAMEMFFVGFRIVMALSDE